MTDQGLNYAKNYIIIIGLMMLSIAWSILLLRSYRRIKGFTVLFSESKLQFLTADHSGLMFDPSGFVEVHDHHVRNTPQVRVF